VRHSLSYISFESATTAQLVESGSRFSGILHSIISQNDGILSYTAAETWNIITRGIPVFADNIIDRYRLL
jgi:hypothetical protein